MELEIYRISLEAHSSITILDYRWYKKWKFHQSTTIEMNGETK